MNFGISTSKALEYIEEEYQGHPIYNNRSVNLDKDAKLSYQTLVYGANFMGGIELSHYFKVGIGLGYLYYKQKDNRIPFYFNVIPNSITTHGVPLFVYVRSDFLDKKSTPYLDFKIGNNFLITKETVNIYTRDGIPVAYDIGKFKLKNGLFLASNIGIAFKIKSKNALNVSIGYRYISREHDFLYDMEMWFSPSSGKETYRKIGFITADHQFVLNIGLLF